MQGNNYKEDLLDKIKAGSIINLIPPYLTFYLCGSLIAIYCLPNAQLDNRTF